jgi:lysophospholipid acyltransferase (LPLAT)-like uncharacterized protein
MKQLIRSRAVQWTLSMILSGYIDLALATMRWRFVNTEAVDRVVFSDQGMIGAFWHGRIAMAVVGRRVLKHKPRRVLISLSRDGEFIANAVERLGFPAIRGSAIKKKDKAKDKGGGHAFRQAVKFMQDGGCLAITPDGPRGPNQVMQDGIVTLARAAQVPVFVFGLASSTGITLNSWDQGRLPMLFSRGCLVFDGPFFAPRGADPAACEALRADWTERLTAAQRQAEAFVQGREP